MLHSVWCISPCSSCSSHPSLFHTQEVFVVVGCMLSQCTHLRTYRPFCVMKLSVGITSVSRSYHVCVRVRLPRVCSSANVGKGSDGVTRSKRQGSASHSFDLCVRDYRHEQGWKVSLDRKPRSGYSCARVVKNCYMCTHDNNNDPCRRAS